VGLGPLHRFLTLYFPEMGLLAPCPTQNLEDQGLHSVWPLPFDLSGMDGPSRSLLSRQHNSLGHWGAQTSSPQQKGSPWGGSCRLVLLIMSIRAIQNDNVQRTSVETAHFQSRYIQPSWTGCSYHKNLRPTAVRCVPSMLLFHVIFKSTW
jgi:hypothetical protein